jgi:uncharacterized protein (UPF0335 family)
MELRSVIEELAEVINSIDMKNEHMKDILDAAKEEGIDAKLAKKLAVLRAKDKFESYEMESSLVCSTYTDLFGEG